MDSVPLTSSRGGAGLPAASGEEAHDVPDHTAPCGSITAGQQRPCTPGAHAADHVRITVSLYATSAKEFRSAVGNFKTMINWPAGSTKDVGSLLNCTAPRGELTATV